ncbi:alpha/beta fold hydrolase [Bailinhaonella thermotolerans]|uniref:alpha/beta fold hydrolase n=1 Tax=Bailinhaonella thermotolerans TaxID=1070861 RepID=UPI001F5B0A46|nr:alpha/beta fold hydrolase [Bailinhaonella thermotolerans]
MTSADGTRVVFDRRGAGPVIVLVHGASADRLALAEVARLLSPWFTAVTYERRGWAGLDREIEDLAAVIGATGGRAGVFGGSSGAVLALEATVRLPAIICLVLWEPPAPLATAAAVRRPALVLNSGRSPARTRRTGSALARAIPAAVHRVLPGQTPDVTPQALAPELLEFFTRHQ